MSSKFLARMASTTCSLFTHLPEHTHCCLMNWDISNLEWAKTKTFLTHNDTLTFAGLIATASSHSSLKDCIGFVSSFDTLRLIF